MPYSLKIVYLLRDAKLLSFTAGRWHRAELINTRIFHETNILSELFLFLQNQITLSGRVPRLGRYVFVVHFYQPSHPVFPVQVGVDAGHVWSGEHLNLI